jgi:hypothetical protein
MHAASPIGWMVGCGHIFATIGQCSSASGAAEFILLPIAIAHENQEVQ